MSKKKDNIDLTDFETMPDVLDGRHQVIPIITGGDEVAENVAIPESLPILSLRSSVLFPGAITPITVGREKSIKLVRDVNAEGGLLGAVLQRESEVEIPAPDDMYKVGTVARIIKILEMPNGNLTVILSGLEKIEVVEYLQSEPYLKATVRTIRDSQPDAGNVEFQALVDSVREVSLNIINISPSMPKEAAFAIKNIDSQRGLINFICSNMDFDDEDRQALLEAPGLLARARKLLEILVREQQLAELKGEIQEKVKREIDKQQRDYYLQQQMRTIQDELGDSTDAEIEQMREAASKKNWPKEVGELFEKELSKVERLNPAVAEYSVQMTYLQLMLELPWNDVTKDNLDLTRARQQLDADHFGLEEVKERILEHLAVIKLKGDLKSPILCLYGPPGVGKTSLGRSVATALGRKFGRISLGGLHDESEIRGHRRTYIGAMPGRVIQTIKRCGSSNPVIILDEVDKVTVSNHGDPSSALLEVGAVHRHGEQYRRYQPRFARPHGDDKHPGLYHGGQGAHRLEASGAQAVRGARCKGGSDGAARCRYREDHHAVYPRVGSAFAGQVHSQDRPCPSQAYSLRRGVQPRDHGGGCGEDPRQAQVPQRRVRDQRYDRRGYGAGVDLRRRRDTLYRVGAYARQGRLEPYGKSGRRDEGVVDDSLRMGAGALRRVVDRAGDVREA